MARTLVKVEVHDLRPGMYVAKLDRPWLDTPFLFQGFAIRGKEQLEQLAAHCEHVYIDVERDLRQKVPAQPQRATAINLSSGVSEADIAGSQDSYYHDTRSMEKELGKARVARTQVSTLVADLVESTRAKRALDGATVRRAVAPMVESIVRNADAMAWLTQIRERRSLVYQHAINCSVWMIVFGRSMGLGRATLEDLGMIGLLFDLGKSRLPPGLITRTPPLPEKENALLKTHVKHGVAILKQMKGVSHRVQMAVMTHHERFNGSGYPNGLSGKNIPVYGRMAGLVDWYQSHVRPYDGTVALSSVQAIAQLHQMRSRLFQAELVDRFVQAIGVYPTGTLVELNSGEIGAVIAQNPSRRLQPIVMVVTNAAKKRLRTFEKQDLSVQSEHRAGTTRELKIVGSCKAGAYGIDPATLDVKTRAKGWFGIRSPLGRSR